MSIFSIIIPTRGGERDFKRIANHLTELPPSIPIIIVANRNYSEVPHEILCLPNTKVFFIPGGGVARARNAGLWLCKTDVCVFLDDDVLPEIVAIKELIQKLLTTKAAVITARVLSSSSEADVLSLYNQYFNFDRGEAEQIFSKNDTNSLSPFSAWSIGVGAAFTINSSILKNNAKLVAFDENLSNGRFCGGAEDVDFFLQCLSADLKIIYDPEAVFYHQEAKSLSDLKLKMIRYARADGAFYAKWKSDIKTGEVLQEVLGWADRMRLNLSRFIKGKSSLPIFALLLEPIEKIIGAIWWHLRQL